MGRRTAPSACEHTRAAPNGPQTPVITTTTAEPGRSVNPTSPRGDTKMAQDVTKVRVALSGNVWVADSGSTVPADITTAPNASWTDLGYTDEDGVTFSLSQETEDIMGWQALEPLRTVVTSEPKMFNFVLRQMEKNTWSTAFGGTITTLGAGNYKWTPPSAGTQLSKMFLLEFVDGSLKYRFVYRNCIQQGERELNFVRDNAVNLPLEYKVLAASPNTWELYTNDTAFA